MKPTSRVIQMIYLQDLESIKYTCLCEDGSIWSFSPDGVWELLAEMDVGRYV